MSAAAGGPPSPADEADAVYSVLKDHGRGSADKGIVGYLEPLLQKVITFIKDEGCEADWMYPTPVLVVKNMPIVDVALFQHYLACHLRGVSAVETVADGTACLDRTDISLDYPFCFIGEASRDFHCKELLDLVSDLSLREQQRRHAAGDASLPDCFSDVYGGAYCSASLLPGAAPVRPRKAWCVVAFHDSVMPTASLARFEDAQCRYNYRTLDLVQHCLTSEGLSDSVVCALLHPLSPVQPGYETLRDVPKVMRSRAGRCLRRALSACWESVDIAAATEASVVIEGMVDAADEGVDVAVAPLRGAAVRSAGATVADFTEARAMVVYGFQSGLRVVGQKGTLREKERAQRLVVDMWGSFCKNEGCADGRYGVLVEDFLRVVNVEEADVPLLHGVLQPDSVSAVMAVVHLRGMLTALSGCSKEVYKLYAKKLSMPGLVQERAKLQVHPPGSTHTSPVESVLWVMRKCTAATPVNVIVQKVQTEMRQRGCTPLTSATIEWAISKLVEFDALLLVKSGVIPKIKIVSTQLEQKLVEPSADSVALAVTRSLSSVDDAAAPVPTDAASRPLKQVRGRQGATATMMRRNRWSGNAETEASGSQGTGSGSAVEGPFAPGDTVFVQRTASCGYFYTECEVMSANDSGSYNVKVKATGKEMKSRRENLLTACEHQKKTEESDGCAENSTGSPPTTCLPPKRLREESGPADAESGLRSPPAKKACRDEKALTEEEEEEWLPKVFYDVAQAASFPNPALDSDLLCASLTLVSSNLPEEGRALVAQAPRKSDVLMKLRTSKTNVPRIRGWLPCDGDPKAKWHLGNLSLSVTWQALVDQHARDASPAFALMYRATPYGVLVHVAGGTKKSLETAGWVKPGDGTERSGFALAPALEKAQVVCDAVYETLFTVQEFSCFIGGPRLPSMKFNRKKLSDFLKSVKSEASYTKALRKRTYLRWFSTGADDDALASLIVELVRQELHMRLRAHTVSRGHYAIDVAFARAAGFECPDEESPNVVCAEDLCWHHGEGDVQADEDEGEDYVSSQGSSQGVTVSGSEDD